MWFGSRGCVSRLHFFFFLLRTCLGGQRPLFMLMFMNSSRSLLTFQPLYQSYESVNNIWDLQISFFNNFFIKNGSYDTIHIFKNYFATMFSVFSFSKISSIQTNPSQKFSLTFQGQVCFQQHAIILDAYLFFLSKFNDQFVFSPSLTLYLPVNFKYTFFLCHRLV